MLKLMNCIFSYQFNCLLQAILSIKLNRQAIFLKLPAQRWQITKFEALIVLAIIVEQRCNCLRPRYLLTR